MQVDLFTARLDPPERSTWGVAMLRGRRRRTSGRGRATVAEETPGARRLGSVSLVRASARRLPRGRRGVVWLLDPHACRPWATKRLTFLDGRPHGRFPGGTACWGLRRALASYRRAPAAPGCGTRAEWAERCRAGNVGAPTSSGGPSPTSVPGSAARHLREQLRCGGRGADLVEGDLGQGGGELPPAVRPGRDRLEAPR